MADERFAVSRFARGAGRHGAVARYSEFIHYFTEVPERFYRFFENLFAELGAQENTFAQSQGITFVVQWFDVQCGVSARHGQAHCVGTGVDGGDMNRLGHSALYRQRWASAAE